DGCPPAAPWRSWRRTVSDDPLRALAREAGIAVEWTAASGKTETVARDVLIRLLDSLGFPCRTPAQITECHAQLTRTATPSLVTATVGEPVFLPVARPKRRARLVLEGGSRRDVTVGRRKGRTCLAADLPAGYHQLHLNEQVVTLAVAPKRCFALPDVTTDQMWGLAVQLYGL